MDIKIRYPFDGNFPITQVFGRYSQDVITKFNLTKPYEQLHWGIDFGLPNSTPVLAAATGIIKAVGVDSRSGKYVIINHDNGFMTHYYHLSEQEVTAGQQVNEGQRIALSGDTGMTTGPHLHFQLNVNGQRIDPKPFLENYNTPQLQSEAPQAPQFVSEILDSSVKNEASSTPVKIEMKQVGNTSDSNLDDLSKIANHLGLPLSTTSYDQILIWNPELKTGNYDNIPSGHAVFIPQTYNLPEAVQIPEATEYDFTVTSGETLGDILLKKYNTEPDWAGYHNGTGNIINLLNKIKELNPNFSGLEANSVIKLPVKL